VALPLPPFVMRWLGDGAYQRRISDGLSNVWDRADERELELSEIRAVAFSDHHRGRGDGADDFKRCEQAYCAALGWYLEQEYQLWLIGDVEELWENRPARVVDRYERVLEVEKNFGDRLWRIWGNHDMAWRSRRNVRRFLAGHVAEDGIREGIRVTVTDQGEPLGTLFLVHGHQGTIDSGNLLLLPVSRFVVRFIWATLQRSQGFASTSPANDSVVRGKHDRAMAAWADARPEKLVLVAGHTHKPVFPGSFPPDVEAEARAADEAYKKALETGVDLPAARARRELAWARAVRVEQYDPPKLTRPCYFNTGCCSFGDGDVTGLEFADGTVRLVRWLDDDGAAAPRELTPPLDLRTVFSGVSGTAS
jgi:UDP-2,3-diacylglucosamine pyrophosphatase LpxH